jgi:hypothetical protein
MEIEIAQSLRGVEVVYAFTFPWQYHSSRIGDGVAILLGDLVFAWSYESMLSYARTGDSMTGRAVVHDVIVHERKEVQELNSTQQLHVLMGIGLPERKIGQIRTESLPISGEQLYIGAYALYFTMGTF